jgi:hypothetical protein
MNCTWEDCSTIHSDYIPIHLADGMALCQRHRNILEDAARQWRESNDLLDAGILLGVLSKAQGGKLIFVPFALATSYKILTQSFDAKKLVAGLEELLGK